jgi:hypothetical protein
MEGCKDLNDENEVQALKKFYKNSISEISENMNSLEHLAKSYHYMLARYRREKGTEI